MEWSPQQDQALLHVQRWLRDADKQIFRLFGFAGTGKTTLAKYFAEHVDGDVLFGAYTGKAALVLRKMGCTNASTIHSMIYNPREKSLLRLQQLEDQLTELRAQKKHDSLEAHELDREIKKERKFLSSPNFEYNEQSEVSKASLVIIDECSMVDDEVGADLLSFRVPVLVIGDPFQLPPVKKRSSTVGFFTNVQNPDVMLTEIHRQALDNPIIQLSKMIREEKICPPVGKYGESRIVSSSTLGISEFIEADQVLVGTNKTRVRCNNIMRKELGFTDPYPERKDKLVCLHNNYDRKIFNGELFTVKEFCYVNEHNSLLDMSDPESNRDIKGLSVHNAPFVDPSYNLTYQEKRRAQEMTYGYALTVHKSQGSQWNNVIISNESAAFRESRLNWLYTAVTRAVEKVTVVQV